MTQNFKNFILIWSKQSHNHFFDRNKKEIISSL